MVSRVITKDLVGQEDILFGESTKSQTRNGTVYSITRIDKIHPVDTLAALAVLSVANADLLFTKVEVLGGAAKGDGGGGLFYYDSTEPQSNHNGTTIIQANGIAVNGCYVKITDETATQTNLAAVGSAINTVNKYEGKQIWDSTNKRPLWSKGSNPGDVWIDGANATVHTPI